MVGCSAVGCKSRSEKGSRMYGFPSTDAERRKRWLAKLSRKDFTFTTNYNNYKLCEAHFEQDQFCFTRQGRLRLVKDAVPTIFSHRRPVKRRKPPSQRHANLVPLRNEEILTRVRSDHSYYTKTEPVIRNPAPEQKENQEMDFLSLLKMHAIDIVQVDFSQQSVTVRESEAQQSADSSKGAKGSGVSKLGQTASRLSQSERPSEETAPLDFPPSPGESPCQSPERETEPGGNMTQVELCPPPVGLEAEHADLLTASSIKFLQDLVNTFDQEVDQVLTLRVSRKAHLDMTGDLPEFRDASVQGDVGPSVRTDPLWRVSPVPPRLTRRHVDVGDLAPCDTQRLLLALRSPAQGLQIDFDDGNCPTYRNQIKGLHNVYKFVNSLFPEAPPIKKAPVLMLRPRAWNMVEHNMMVNGKEVPGPLFDFALLMFHCGKKLFEQESGPYFYLSKVESYHEARLWNNIFVWTQDKLGLPQGSIKATVLIENVLAAFQMEEILFELKDHSAGLNCGIWDYSASFINKFGHRGSFLLPDRSKYVNMQKRFLRRYMDLLVQTCHHRGALATGGMAATLMPHDTHSATYRTLLDTVTRLKLLEIKAGVDGFMVYDLALIEPMQKLFQTHTHGDNQLDQCREDVTVTAEDLLTMPSGGVTLEGLQYNITVGILFIDAWLSGKGHFFFRGQVEDSATAEISRSQVWQWIRHQTRLEDDGQTVTRALVSDLTVKVINNLLKVTHKHSVRAVQRLNTAANMFLEVVQRRDFPEFLTTYLNLDHTFLSSQAGGGDQGDPSAPPPNLSTQPHPDQQDPDKPPPNLSTQPHPHQQDPDKPPPNLSTQPHPHQQDPDKPPNTLPRRRQKPRSKL